MQADEYISAPVGDGLLLARRHTNRLFALNATARLVWECRARSLTPAEIAAALADAYGIDLAAARRDVDAALRHWREEGLLDSGRPALVCVVGGCRFLLRLGPPDLRQVMGSILSSFVARDDADFPPERRAIIEVTERDGKYLVSSGEAAALLAPTLDAAVESVQTGMLRHIFNATDWQLSMHSAAVGRANGCILIAGESGRGKTTLLARMLRNGFDYVADDLVLVIPPDLAVLPIVMPLVLKRGSWADLEDSLPGLDKAQAFRRAGRDVKYWTPPRERIARNPVPIRAIVFPRFGKAAQFAATQLDAFSAIERIMRAPTRIGIPLAHEAVERLAALVQACPIYDVAYDNAEIAAQWVGDLLVEP
jgi:hypothetical protein